MNQINAAATSAREAARSTDGKFGSYSTPESAGVELDGGDSVADRRSVTAANGSSYNVQLIREGGAYGATGSLTADGDMVEFRDAGSDQMVSRYYTGDFNQARTRGGGLSLYGGEPKWSLDHDTVKDVDSWVQGRAGRTAPGESFEDVQDRFEGSHDDLGGAMDARDQIAGAGYIGVVVHERHYDEDTDLDGQRTYTDESFQVEALENEEDLADLLERNGMEYVEGRDSNDVAEAVDPYRHPYSADVEEHSAYIERPHRTAD